MGKWIGAINSGYFSELFTTTWFICDDIIDVVSPRLDDVRIALLDQPFTTEEVKCALFSMHPDKSSGPDGMNLTFYQHL